MYSWRRCPERLRWSVAEIVRHQNHRRRAQQALALECFPADRARPGFVGDRATRPLTGRSTTKKFLLTIWM
jgi:hypothetical protein